MTASAFLCGLQATTMAQESASAVTLPFSCDFENGTEGWTFLQSTASPNHWYRGNSVDGNDTYCLYISNDEGASNSYDGSPTAVSHAYFTVDIETAGEYLLDFRYVCEGEGQYDYLRVALLDEAPVTDEQITSGTQYSGDDHWTEMSLAFSVESPGTKYVVFSWRNDGSGAYGGAAIDDVAFRINDCPAPTDFAAEAIAYDQVRLSWEPYPGFESSVQEYRIQYRQGVSAAWMDAGTVAGDQTSFVVEGLSENTLYYFRIMSWRSEESHSNWTDGNCSARTPYSCPAPANVTGSENTADGTYELQWETDAARSLLYYRLAGEEEWTGVEVTGTTYAIPVQKGNVYQARLRSLCGEGDTSVQYSETYEFQTACDMVSVPYVERFEEDSWSGSYLTCWTILNVNGDEGVFGFGEGAGMSGSGCARYRYSLSNAADDYLISPRIDLTGVANATASFYVRAHSASYPEKYSVLLSTTTPEAESFTTVLSEETELASTEYEMKAFDLSAYQGEQVYIAIRVTSAANRYYLYVDDFMVTTCPVPYDIALSEEAGALSESSAKVAFASSSNDNTFEYRIAGTDEWTVLENQISPVSLTDLIANTTYEVRIKSVCGEDESPYSAVFSFSTPCAPVAFPFSSDFSAYGEGSIPDCWTIIYERGSTLWELEETSTGMSLVYEGANQQVCEISTPVINLSGAIRDRLELELSYTGPYTTGGTSPMAYLFFSTDNGITWDSIEGYPMVETILTTINIPLGSLVGDAPTVRFMLRGVGNSSYYSGFRIYEFNVQHSPICFPPVNVVVEDIEAHRAVISWTEPENGDPQYYRLAYYPEEESGSPVEVQTTGRETQYELTSLEQHTTYTVALSTMCSTEGSEDTAFVFQTPYSCPAPTGLHSTLVETTRLGIAWEGSGGPFEVDYRATSSAEWIPAGTVEENQTVIEGLEPATMYDIRVRVICAEDDSSLYATLSVATPCEAEAVPYEETFESANPETDLPLCWTYQWLSNVSSQQHWTLHDGEAQSGESALRFNAYNLGSGSSSLAISPALLFEEGSVYTLDFWVFRDPRCTSSTNYQLEGVKVFVGPTYDTADALLVDYIHGNRNLPPAIPESASDDSWFHYSYTLTDIAGSNFVLLYGISEYGYDIYIDNLRISPVYETEIALAELAGLPRAVPAEFPVQVSVLNNGISDFAGNVEIAYSVDGGERVTETLAFPEDAPLYPGTPYDYVFSAKAEVTEAGSHTVEIALAKEDDPVQDNNTLETTLTAYDPVSLPYENLFDGSAPQGSYAVSVDGNADGERWNVLGGYEALQIYAEGDGDAMDDDWYTPGIAMPACVLDYSFAYGALDAGKVGKMEVSLVKDFGDTSALFRLVLDSIVDEAEEIHGSVFVREAGNYMFRFHAFSDAGQSGLSVSNLQVGGNLMMFREIHAEICSGDTYPFGGRDLSQSGIYYDTVEVADAGMPDTLLVLDLQVNPSYEFELEETICAGDTLRIGGEAYTESGQYTISLETATGCDSIYHINLRVQEPYFFELDTAICEGTSIEFGGVTYTEAGEYTETYESVDGCDSTYHLVLAINPLPEPPVVELLEPDSQEIPPFLEAATPEDSVRWYLDEEWIAEALGKQYTPVENGTYYATAVNGCGESEPSNEVVVTHIVGVEGLADADAPKVYPNPVTDNLYVRAQQDILLVRMYAQSGKMVMEAEGSSLPEMSLPVDYLSAGTYILKVRTTAGWFTYKVVKQ